MLRPCSGFPSGKTTIGGMIKEPAFRGRSWWSKAAFGVVAASLMMVEPAQASWYALLIGASGPGESTFAMDVQAVQAGLTSPGRWFGYGTAGHTLALSSVTTPASSASVVNDLKQISTAITLANDKDPHLLFYFSGHGGTSTKLFDEKPPAANASEEYIAYNVQPASVEGEYDSTLPGVVRNNVPNCKSFLFIIDSCKSGGFINNGNTAGTSDLEKLQSSYVIASALEDQNSPLASILSPAFENFLKTKFGSFTGPNIATPLMYAGKSFTGPRRADLTGEGEISQFNTIVTDTIDSVAGGPNTDDIFLESVPEPSSLILFGFGAGCTLLRLYRGRGSNRRPGGTAGRSSA